MDKVPVGKVHAYMRNAYAVYTKENKVTFGRIIRITYPLAAFPLLPCSAHDAGSIYFVV